MPKAIVVQVSATDIPQFQRLVWLLEQTESLGRVNGDEELLALVDACRDDLVAGRAEPEGT